MPTKEDIFAGAAVFTKHSHVDIVAVCGSDISYRDPIAFSVSRCAFSSNKFLFHQMIKVHSSPYMVHESLVQNLVPLPPSSSLKRWNGIIFLVIFLY